MGENTRIVISANPESAKLLLACVTVVQKSLANRYIPDKKSKVAKAKLELKIKAMQESLSDMGECYYEEAITQILKGNPAYLQVMQRITQAETDVWTLESLKQQIAGKIAKQQGLGKMEVLA